MKLLDSGAFEAINSALRFETQTARIIARIESYSCKMAGRHKKLFKEMNADSCPDMLQYLSPSESMQMAVSSARACSSQGNATELGAFQDTITQKTLCYLICTLNASFPEYDFSSCRSEEFSREQNFAALVNTVDNHLSVMGLGTNEPLKTRLWDAIDHEICISECEIYRYTPDENYDPFTDGGCSWFCHYFFYNKKRKRIVFFMCQCIRKKFLSSPDEDDEDEDYESA